MLNLFAITVMRRATSSGNVNNGRKTKKKKNKQVQKQADNDSDSEGGRIAAVEEIMFLMHEEHDGRFGPTVEEKITIVSDDTIPSTLQMVMI
jgi:hypothetical protein